MPLLLRSKMGYPSESSEAEAEPKILVYLVNPSRPDDPFTRFLMPWPVGLRDIPSLISSRLVSVVSKTEAHPLTIFPTILSSRAPSAGTERFLRGIVRFTICTGPKEWVNGLVLGILFRNMSLRRSSIFSQFGTQLLGFFPARPAHFADDMNL